MSNYTNGKQKEVGWWRSEENEEEEEEGGEERQMKKHSWLSAVLL